MKTSIFLLLLLSLAPGHAATYLIDFGPNTGTYSMVNDIPVTTGAGATTPSPQGSIYWNNVSSSTTVNPNTTGTATNLVDTANGASSIGISGVGRYNGFQTGGLLNPNAMLLGDFAVGSATGDYLYFQAGDSAATVTITGLNPALDYDFQLFGTRETANGTDTRWTRYSITGDAGSQIAWLQTSGAGSGSAAKPNGNDDTFATFSGISPTAGGTITLTFTGFTTENGATGTFGYLGAMSITAVPEPSTALLAGSMLGFALLRRRRQA